MSHLRKSAPCEPEDDPVIEETLRELRRDRIMRTTIALVGLLAVFIALFGIMYLISTETRHPTIIPAGEPAPAGAPAR